MNEKEITNHINTLHITISNMAKKLQEIEKRINKISSDLNATMTVVNELSITS